MAIASISRGQNARQAQAPIDLVRLAANTLGNRDLEMQVLRLFVTQSRAIMERLDDENEADALKDLVHTLKGSARGVGAERVATCCEDLETGLRAGKVPNFSSLRRVVEETNAYIADLLSD